MLILSRVIVAIVVLLSFTPVFADTHTADSCSVADLATAIGLETVEAGDVVACSGNETWTSVLTINKSITLQQTSGTITIGSGGYITATNGTNNWRITGFTFATANTNYFAIYPALNGSFTGCRIDHNTFTGFHYAIYLYGNFSSATASSVIDSNTFNGGGVQVNGLADTGEEIGGGAAWDNETQLGTQNFVFIENNVFTDNNALSAILHVIAVNKSARVVARYNDIKAESTGTYKGIADAIDFHGYGHGSNIRAARAYEVYNNKQTNTNSTATGTMVYLRGGTGVIYKNQTLATASYYRAPITLFDTRAYPGGSSTLSSSVSGYCENNASGAALCNASYVRLQVASDPYLHFEPDDVVTGVSSGASGTVLAVTNSGGYYVYFSSITGGPFQNNEDLQVDGSTVMKAAAASEAQTGEGYPCCDQVGRGKDQASEPVYVWSNSDGTNATTLGLSDEGQSDFFTATVDYVDGGTTAKDGYSAYECPHPLADPTNAKTCSTTVAGVGGYGIDAETTYYNVTVSIVNGTGGTLSPSPGAEAVASGGNSSTYTATPYNGWKIKAWAGTCGATGSASTYQKIGVTEACTVTIEFEEIKLMPW